MEPRFGNLDGGVQDAIPHAMDLLLFIPEFELMGTTILVKRPLHMYARLWVVVRGLAINDRLCLMTALYHPMGILMLA